MEQTNELIKIIEQSGSEIKQISSGYLKIVKTVNDTLQSLQKTEIDNNLVNLVMSTSDSIENYLFGIQYTYNQIGKFVSDFSFSTSDVSIEAINLINTGYTTIIKDFVKTLEILKSSGVDSIDVEIFQNISSIVKQYLDIISQTLKEFSNTSVNGNISELLGYIEYRTENELEIGEKPQSKFVVIDGLLQLSQVFNSLNKLVLEVTKTDYGNFVKARRNIFSFSQNIQSLMEVMVRSLSIMSQSLNQNEIKQLMGEDMTEQIKEYFETTKADKTFKDGNLAKVTESEMLKSQTERSNKNYGIFDVFERYLAIISSISNFKAPPIAKTLINLKITNMELNMFVKSFTDILSTFNKSELTKESLESFSERIDLIRSAISSLKDTFDDVNIIGNPKFIAPLIIAQLNLVLFNKFLNQLLKSITSISEDVLDTSETKLKTILDCTNKVHKLIDEIVTIAKELLVVPLLFVPALIGLGFLKLFILNIVSLIVTLKPLNKILNNKDFLQTKIQLEHIKSIVLSLDLIMLALITSIPLTSIVISNFSTIAAGIGVVIAVVLAISIFLILYQKLEMVLGGKLGVTNSANTKTVVAMACIAGMVWAMEAIMLALVAIQYTVQLLDFMLLLKSFGYLAGVMLTVIGIGFLVSNPVVGTMIALSTVAFIAMNVMILSLITITLLLITFSNIKMPDMIAVQASMKAVTDSIKVVSDKIWETYKEGNGIIKTAIVGIWLITSLFTVGALILVSGAMLILTKIAANLKEEEVAQSVNKIITLSHHIVDIAIGGEGFYNEQGERKANPEDVGFIDRLIQIGGGILEVAKSLLAFANLATVALSVAVLWGITAMLNKIVEFNLNEEQIVPKVNQIILCANSVSQAVLSAGNAKTSEEASKETVLGKVGRYLKGGVQALGGALGNVASAGVLGTTLVTVAEVESLASMLTKLQETQLDENSIVEKVNQIIRVSSLVAQNVGTDTASPYSIDSKKVADYHLYVDDSIKLMKSVNSLNTDKIVKYSDMWVKMTEFMHEVKNLNIEELSDAIVNRIAPAMSNISDNVNSMSKASGSTSMSVSPVKSSAPSAVQPTTKIAEPTPKSNNTDIILEDIKNILNEYFESRM